MALVLQSLVLGLLLFLHPLHTIPQHQLHQKVIVCSFILCHIILLFEIYISGKHSHDHDCTLRYTNRVNYIPSGASSTGAIAGGAAAGAALLFAIPAIAFALWRRRKPEDHFFDVPGQYYIPQCGSMVLVICAIQFIDMVSFPSAEEDPEVHLGQLKRFSLRELQVATDNFSNRNVLGRGGFGKVYKGRLTDGSLVAVKRLKEERTPGGELQFQTEVELISMAVHKNLLRLRGFCMTPTERLLVYPYMVNGSVASRLRGNLFFPTA